MVNLSVLESRIKGEAKVPLLELQSAIAKREITNADTNFLRQYFLQHINVVSGKLKWRILIDRVFIVESNDSIVGKYQELIVHFVMYPPQTKLLRNFTFNYDGVIHQVINHSIMVYIHHDWTVGITEEKDAKQIGVIQFDIPSGKIIPLEVSLEKGSWWIGFTSMLKLGMNHIKEGLDHLLFLIVLLLPSTLLIDGHSWGQYGGLKYSFTRLFKIITSFTIGHSITLLIGAFGWVHLPQAPVEQLIAVSILISSFHAFKPIFSGKETFIALFFGLIHGLAFASALYNLHLGAGTLALSVLGFNCGIEFMQLFIMLMIVPWMILLSTTFFYRWVRIFGSVISAIAALAWLLERTYDQPNFITQFLLSSMEYGFYYIIGFAVFSICCYTFVRLNFLQKSTQ